MEWRPGSVIVERQVWHGRVVAAFPSVVIESGDDRLVTYVAPGAEFGFVEGAYPGPDGRHPWYGRRGWAGHGMLQVLERDRWVAVQHYWTGQERSFACWYLNIQEPLRPTEIGFDSQDLELDVVVAPDGRWSIKDDELLDQRVQEGRWTPTEAGAIRAIGDALVRDVLEPDCWWWDRAWSDWVAPRVEPPRLPSGWADVPAQPFAGFPVS